MLSTTQVAVVVVQNMAKFAALVIPEAVVTEVPAEMGGSQEKLTLAVAEVVHREAALVAQPTLAVQVS